MAQTVGQISRVTGSLEISSGATEHSLVLTTGITNTNAYTLQINSKPFKSTACKTSPNPACLGWQQFVYTTYFDGISMQDWVLFYDTTCPSGWKTFATYHPTIDCYKTSMRTSLASIPPVSALNNLKFMAFDTAGGNDTVKMTTPTTAATIKAAGQPDSVTTGGLGLANNWHVAEFDIFGDDDGNEAYFSSNTTLKAKMVLHDGTKTAPMCKQADSLTGERNNLNLAATPAFSTTQTSPTMLSRQSNSVAPGHGSCATAKGIGDTHLTTFDNVTRLYTFQAAGDFELATVTPTTTGPATGLRGAVVPATSTARSTTAPTTPAAPSTATPRKFSVQARQVSGAPTWPNADTNQAVAARVDTSDVALCTGPSRLEVNGGPVTLPGGGRITLPGGASVSNEAGTYVIRDANGDSLRAGIYTNGVQSWINETVGLGSWPEPVRGLLANALSNPEAIEARTGTVLTAPFAFDELYGLYANSWRVTPSESLLSACGPAGPGGAAHNILTPGSVTPKLAKTARATCVAAGVKAAGLLYACTVDVAVLGKPAAAAYGDLSATSTTTSVYTSITVDTITPATVPTTSLSGGGQSGPFISVPIGTPVTDTATPHGTTSAAGHTVTYRVYSNDTCTTVVATTTSTVNVAAGLVPPSAPVTLSKAGTYFWQATYSGGPASGPSASTCGLDGEAETVTTPPTITSLSRTSGPATGGTQVTITGTGFSTVRNVKFGTTTAQSFSVRSATQLAATSPAHVGGTVRISVTTAGGTTPTTSADRYTFTVPPPAVSGVSPSAGPAAGGTAVTVSGSGFTGATTVFFGTGTGRTLSVNAAGTQLTVKSPAGTSGASVDVRVVTPAGESPAMTADLFTYGPTIASLSRTSGPVAGGTKVTITGTGFSTVRSVKFGTTTARTFTVRSATQIVATSPAHAAGQVRISVTTAAGTTPATGNDLYTY